MHFLDNQGCGSPTSWVIRAQTWSMNGDQKHFITSRYASKLHVNLLDKAAQPATLEWQTSSQSWQALYHSAEAAKAGVTEVAAYQLWRHATPDPPWLKISPHFHRLSAEEKEPFRSAGAGHECK